MNRIDQLETAPRVGTFYKVPAVLWAWAYGGENKMWWPVIGPKHNDTEFFDFHHLHYHTDVRFLSKRHLSKLLSWRPEGRLGEALSRPLSSTTLPEGPEAPTWRTMRCTMSAVDYPFGDRGPVIKLNEHLVGKQCAKSRFGWICPHRNVHLGSMAAIDGIITCPLHGLRINAETGIVIGPQPGTQIEMNLAAKGASPDR